MADREVDFLLVGGGMASAACAAALREEGADGSILMVGREADPPYERPPLSKEYLAGKTDRDAALWKPAGWWESQGVELATRVSVMKLDAGERVARLSTKEEVSFDKALLATGANVRRLRVDGSDLDGIHYLRELRDSDALRERIAPGTHMAIVGAGWIGSEVAASARQLGAEVTAKFTRAAPEAA